MSTELLNKLKFYLLLLFVVFLSIPIYTNGTSLAIIIITVLVFINAIKEKQLNFQQKYFFLLVPFCVYALGLFNTTNLDYGLNFLLRNISFILLPLIFSNINLSSLQVRRIKQTFLLTSAITGLYTFYIFYYYFNIGTKLYKIISIEVFHSTYLGLIFSIGFLVSIIDYLKNKKLHYGLLSIAFLVFALITSARIIFIALILLIIFGAFFKISSRTNRMLVLFSIIILSIVSVLFVPSINSKFKQFKEIESLEFDKNNYYSISSRLGKIEAAVKVIEKNPFKGSGTGDLYEFLEAEYLKMNFTMGYKYNYNPHNQYLSFLARNGLIGGSFAVFAVYLLPFIRSWKPKDYLTIGFVLLISIVSLTESILDVQKGIYIYVFFSCLFLYRVRCKN